MPTALDTAVNLTGAAITEGQAKAWFTAMRAALAEMGDPLARFGHIQNLSLLCTVAGNALTIEIRDRAGAVPSANSPASIPFRNATLTSGDFSVINVTAANTLVISSGSTLGAPGGSTPFRIWIVAFNDAGTLRIGAVCCFSTSTAAFVRTDSILGLREGIWSSTAEGGAGAADSVKTIYTGTAVTSKAMRILGYAEWGSGLATPGTWASAPTKVQLFGPDVPLPGAAIQVVNEYSGTGSAMTSSTLADVTNGSLVITPNSNCNVIQLDWHWYAQLSRTAGEASSYEAQLLRGSTSVYPGSTEQTFGAVPSTGTNQYETYMGTHVVDFPASASAQTYKLQHHHNGTAATQITTSRMSKRLTELMT